MSTPSDPQRGGQQPDPTPPGRSDRSAASPTCRASGPVTTRTRGYGNPPGPVRRATVRRSVRSVPTRTVRPAVRVGPPARTATNRGSPAASSPRPGTANPAASTATPALRPAGRPGTATSPTRPGTATSPTARIPPGPTRARYAYSPYGTPPPYPAGLDDGGVSAAPRPGVMAGALVMLILSALPFLAVGVLMVIADRAERAPAGDPERPAAGRGGRHAGPAGHRAAGGRGTDGACSPCST